MRPEVGREVMLSAQDGTRLAYRLVGQGDPLVCLPGGPMLTERKVTATRTSAVKRSASAAWVPVQSYVSKAEPV